MGKYDSPYFNSEKYYDPTAGAVLSKLAAEERAKYTTSYNAARHMIYTNHTEPIRAFAYRFAKQYETEHGRKKNGKAKALGSPVRNENYIRAYIYCMDNAGADSDALENAVKALFNIEGRRIRQCFTHTGDLGKLINAWIDFTKDGRTFACLD